MVSSAAAWDKDHNRFFACNAAPAAKANFLRVMESVSLVTSSLHPYTPPTCPREVILHFGVFLVAGHHPPRAHLLEFRAIASANVSELLRPLYKPSFSALPFFVRC
jgi:hypothetical protein